MIFSRPPLRGREPGCKLDGVLSGGISYVARFVLRLLRRTDILGLSSQTARGGGTVLTVMFLFRNHLDEYLNAELFRTRLWLGLKPRGEGTMPPHAPSLQEFCIETSGDTSHVSIWNIGIGTGVKIAIKTRVSKSPPKQKFLQGIRMCDAKCVSTSTSLKLALRNHLLEKERQAKPRQQIASAGGRALVQHSAISLHSSSFFWIVPARTSVNVD